MQISVAKCSNCAAVHKQQQSTVRLNGKSANLTAFKNLTVLAAYRIITKDSSSGDVGPIDLAVNWMPQRTLPNNTIVISDKFNIHV